MNVRPPKDEDLRIGDSLDVFKIMQKILMRQNRLHRMKEYFWVIGLSTRYDIQYIELVAIGTLNQVALDPVEIFSFAVSKKCKKIILCHNHPSGDVTPSKTDKEVTAKLKKGSEYLGIEILDHIIISETEYYSLGEHNLI